MKLEKYCRMTLSHFGIVHILIVVVSTLIHWKPSFYSLIKSCNSCSFFFSAKIDSEEEDEDDLFSGKKEKSESDNDEEEESEEEPQQPKKVIVVKCKYSTYRTQTFIFILYLCTILYLFSYGFHSIYWDVLWNHDPSQVTFFYSPKEVLTLLQN